MKKLILIGGGGHCKACIDVIEETSFYSIVGILDLPSKLETHILGYPVVGTDDDLIKFVERGFSFLITIGQIKDSSPRKRIFDTLRSLNADIVTIISPRSHVSCHSTIGDGTIIMHGCVVNAEANVGENCIINTGSIIEHEVTVGDHCHVSTGSILNGGSLLGDTVFLGSGAIVSNQISICDGSVIGANSLVLKSIVESGTYVGIPVKLKKNE